MLRSVSLLLALAGPLIAQEIPIATPTATGSSELNTSPLVATNGSTYAVAWQEGARPRVAILDRSGREIARTTQIANQQAFPQDIASFGSDYIVIYETSNLLNAAVIAADGTIRANQPVLFGWSGSIATSGSTAVVMNERGWAVAIDAELRQVTPPSLISASNTYSPDIASGGSRFYGVWLDAGALRGSEIFPTLPGPGTINTIGPSDPVGLSSNRPSIASSGTSFGVAWKIAHDVHFAEIVDGVATPTRTMATDASGVPSIAWTGSSYLIAYPSGDDVVLLQTANGEKNVIRRANIQGQTRVAASPAGALVVREEMTSCFGNAEIVGTLAGTSSTFLLTTGTSAQTESAAAFDGHENAVAFIERGDVSRLRMSFSPFPDRVLDLHSGGNVTKPAIVAGAGAFLVVWLERQKDCSSSLKSRLVDRSGPLSDEQTIAARVAQTRPAVGWNGNEFVIVWQPGDATELDAVRLGPDGTLLDRAPVPLTGRLVADDLFASVDVVSPSIQWAEGAWLLVWQAKKSTYIPLYPYPTPGFSEVRSRRIARDLSAVSAERMLATGAAFPVLDARQPVVVWSDARGVVTARLDGGGGALDERVLTSKRPAASLLVACSSAECLASADGTLFHFRSSGEARATLTAPVASMTTNGSGFLLVVVRNDPAQLFARELPPTKPRRRAVR